jgi:hypothetical protein
MALLASVLLAWARFARDLLSLGHLLSLPLYLAWKVPIYLGLLTRPQRSWVRTDRSPVERSEPDPAWDEPPRGSPSEGQRSPGIDR